MNGADKWRGLLLIGLIVIIVSGLILIVAAPGFAQEATGTIFGSVNDAQGGAVPDAMVTVTNTGTGVARTQTTSNDGAYRFSALQVGDYQVVATKGGFQKAQRNAVKLQVTDVIPVDFTLQVGSTSQTVVVTEEAPVVNTTSSSVGGTVNEEKVSDLPLNGRNYTDLTLLQPGITKAYISGGGNENVITVFAITGTQWSSNGATPFSNLILLDGAQMTNGYGNNSSSALGTTLGVDGIQEYHLLTNTFSAEYGQVMGSVTTIASKSGTNQFHGDAFDYLRNGALDARNYFDVLDTANFNGSGTNKSLPYPGKRLPPYQRNDFGGSVGGPIKHDKTFFYTSFEGLRPNIGLSVALIAPPKACFYGSNTSAAAATSGPTLNSQIPAFINNTATNPYGVCTSLPTAVVPVANGTNAQGVYTGTLPLADLFPQPNVTGYAGFNYTFPFIDHQWENFGQFRVDQTFSTKDSAFLRYTMDYAYKDVPAGFQPVLNQVTSDNIEGTVSETHIFSPTVVNTARFSVSNAIQRFTSGVVGTLPSLPPPGPYMTQTGIDKKIIGTVSPGSGVTSFGPTVSAGTDKTRIYNWSEDIFWTKGKHALKFGTAISLFSVPMSMNWFVPGSVSFSNLANFFSATYSSVSISPPLQWNNGAYLNAPSTRNKTYNYNDFGFYAQDDYRMRKNLTLNLGLRYEFYTPPEGYNLNPRDPANNATFGPLYNNYSLHDFSPRIGFAWDVFGDGKTAVRGGGGIYYDEGVAMGQMLAGDNVLSMLPLSPSVVYPNIANSPNPPVAWTLPLTTPAAGQGFALGTWALERIQHQPSIAQFNLSIERQLPSDMSLTVGYVGSNGWHLWQNMDGNPTIRLGTDPNGLPFYPTNSVGYTLPSNVVLPPGVTLIPSLPLQSQFSVCRAIQNAGDALPPGCKPNPVISSNQTGKTGGISHYNSLQVTLSKRPTKGLEFQANYTFSKLLDNGISNTTTGDGTEPVQTVFDGNRINYGRSTFDVSQNFRMNLIYHAPSIASKAWTGKLVNGWWFGTIISAQSGSPLTVNDFRSLSNNQGQGGTGPVDRPNLDPSYNPSSVVIGNPNRWYDVTMFDLTPLGHGGNAGRGLFNGPDLRDVDFSVNKDTKAGFLGEAGEIEFRAELFNVLNHPNFGNPGAATASTSVQINNSTTAPAGQVQLPTSGTAFSALPSAAACLFTNTSSRQIQLALKILF